MEREREKRDIDGKRGGRENGDIDGERGEGKWGHRCREGRRE